MLKRLQKMSNALGKAIELLEFTCNRDKIHNLQLRKDLIDSEIEQIIGE